MVKMMLLYRAKVRVSPTPAMGPIRPTFIPSAEAGAPASSMAMAEPRINGPPMIASVLKNTIWRFMAAM